MNNLSDVASESQTDMRKELIDFVLANKRLIYKMASSVGIVNENDLEDVNQELCLKIWKYGRSYDEKRNKVNWLYSISRNIARAIKNKMAPIVASDMEMENEREDVSFLESFYGEVEDKTFESVSARERESVIRDKISELPEIQRRILFLVYFQGNSCNETAIKLEIPKSTASVYLFRAKKKLRDKLEILVA